MTLEIESHASGRFLVSEATLDKIAIWRRARLLCVFLVLSVAACSGGVTSPASGSSGSWTMSRVDLDLRVDTTARRLDGVCKRWHTL